MTNAFKLDDIKTAANEKYGHFPVAIDDNNIVILRNVLQIDEDARKALSGSSDDEDDKSTLDRLRQIVRVVADTPEGAERLIDSIGENLAHFTHLIGEYNKATQAGEA